MMGLSYACLDGAVTKVTRCNVLGLSGRQAPESWVQLQALVACRYMQVN